MRDVLPHFFMLAIVSQPADPPVQTNNLPVDGSSIGLVVSLVLGVAVFGGKWMFEQLVASWTRRIDQLESQSQALLRSVDEAIRFNDQQQTVIQQLGRTIEQLSSQIQALTDLSRQMTVLAERQNTFDQRLQNLGGALQATQRAYNDNQKEFLKLKADLPATYLRREDWVRYSPPGIPRPEKREE